MRSKAPEQRRSSLSATTGTLTDGSSDPAKAASSFWDHALTLEEVWPDNFGQFVRLIGRRTLARPREITSAHDLQIVLAQEGVRISTVDADQIWQDFLWLRRSRPGRADKNS